MITDQLREMIVNQLLLLRDKSFGRQRNLFGSHRAAPPNGVHLQQLLISCEPVMRFPSVSCFCMCSFSSPPLQVVLIYPYLQRPPESVPRNPNVEMKTIYMGGGDEPCGACKFLRRKCVKGCVFAPYFCSEEMGASRFGTIHKVFGASNFSKLLMHLPLEHRDDAVVSVLYEAEARLQDPVYGCVSHIYALQQQVANLKGKLAAGYAQLADCSDSDGASLSPAHDQYCKHSEMPSLTSNSNSSSPCDKQYLNPWGLPQQIPSDNVAINNDNEGLWSSYSVCMQGSIHPLSTAQETHVFQDGEGLFEQRHPINNSEDGDLQDLVLAVLRRNR